MSEEHVFRPASLNIVYSSKSSEIQKSGIENVVFKNWAETVECKPEQFFAPKEQKELIQILDLARQENKKVHVVGCKTSSSDIACTNGFMISLLNFNKIINIDKAKHQVKVQAGMVLKDLNRSLYSHNLALPVLGSYSNITVGGAVSVATHGTGIEYGSISSYIAGIEVVLANGNILQLTPANGDLFLAACCSLGCFGVLLTVTLQCEEAFNLQLRKYGIPLKDVIENLDVHLTGSDHFAFLWYPHTDRVIVSHASRTQLVLSKYSWIRKMWSLCWNYSINYHLLEFCYYLSTFFPYFVPTINILYYYIACATVSSKIDRSYKIFCSSPQLKCQDIEWAVPIENTGLVLWEIREWIEATPDVFVHFPIEVRFSKAEDVLLSPAFGRNTCYVRIRSYKPYGKSVPCDHIFETFSSIMLQAGGRPNWATASALDSSKASLMYPFFSVWCQIREKLDPSKMFVNSFAIRLLT